MWQIIISSHSAAIIEELPEDARILLKRVGSTVDVIYGPSVNFALSCMDSQNHADVFLFVEDQKAKTVVEELIRYARIDMSNIQIDYVGASNVVQFVGELVADNKLPVKGLGVVDGKIGISKGCIKLPGSEEPERQLFHDILSSQSGIPSLAARLGIAENSVKDALNRSSTQPDHHYWPREAARLLNNNTEEYFWATLCQVWCTHCVQTQERDGFIAAIQKVL